VLYDEDELVGLGYQLIGKKQSKEAIEIFKLAIEAYPTNKTIPHDHLARNAMARVASTSRLITNCIPRICSFAFARYLRGIGR
jgi:hypothetical protein